MDAINAQIEELQAKLTFAEDLLDALNNTLWRQEQRIERLEEDLRALRRQVQEGLPQAEANPREEIPPHW